MIHEQLQKLDDEQVEDVAGGYIHMSFNGEYAGSWLVINDETGEVMGKYNWVNEAKRAADELGQSTKAITTSQLEKLRNGEWG